MAKSHRRHIRPLATVVIGAAVSMLGTVGIAAAATDTTEPGGTEPMGTEAMGTEAVGTEPMGSMEMTPGELAVVGSGEASSPEAEALCSAAVAAEAAAYSGDEAAMETAFPAVLEAAPAEIRPAVEAVLANAEAGSGDPAFDEPYAELIDYMRANCGYNEMNTEGGDYYFTGVPAEVPAGPVIVTLDNVGAELHVIEFARINDDVTLTAEEILALPEEEAMASVELVGGAFAMPGTSNFGVVDLTPGRYIVLCPIPQGLTPEVAAQMPPEGGSAPPSGSMAPMDTTEGTMPVGTMEGSAPMGELGPPHFVLGMWQEMNVS